MNEQETAFHNASQKGLQIARDICANPGNFTETPIILGTATGAIYGSIARSEKMGGTNPITSKAWLDAFFLTMIGGLKQTMGIELSVSWVKKEE